MAKRSGIVLGAQAVRQTGEMYRWWSRDYRNQPPHRRQPPVIHDGGEETFVAVIYDKKSYTIPPNGDDPINFAGCAPRLLPLFRGEYSWFEIEPDTDPDLPWNGQWRIKPGGRFGEAGTCDAAHELNRSNANIHLLKMRVVMHIGDPFNTNELCPSSDDVSSSEIYWTSSAEVTSTRIRYWFDLCVPREDCAHPYSIASSPVNDQFP